MHGLQLHRAFGPVRDKMVAGKGCLCKAVCVKLFVQPLLSVTGGELGNLIWAKYGSYGAWLPGIDFYIYSIV